MHIIGAVILLLVLAASAYGALLLSQTINGHGNIDVESGIEVSTNTVEWGTINPTSVNVKTINVANVGNTPLTLAFNTSVLPQGMTIAYSVQDGNSLAVGQTKVITMTLTCTNVVAGGFSYTTVITGTQVTQ